MLPNPANDLTEREFQVLGVMVRDDVHKVKDIATKLHLSPNYVYTLLRQLKLRMGVYSTAALIRRAIQYGLISPDGTLLPKIQVQGDAEDGTENLITDVNGRHLATVKSAVKSTLQPLGISTKNAHSDGQIDRTQPVKSAVKSASRSLDTIDWLMAHPHRAGLTALIARAIQDGTIAPPPTKEELVINWLNNNPHLAHLSSRKIAALIGDVSHTLVYQIKCRLKIKNE